MEQAKTLSPIQGLRFQPQLQDIRRKCEEMWQQYVRKLSFFFSLHPVLWIPIYSKPICAYFTSTLRLSCSRPVRCKFVKKNSCFVFSFIPYYTSYHSTIRGTSQKSSGRWLNKRRRNPVAKRGSYLFISNRCISPHFGFFSKFLNSLIPTSVPDP